MTDEFSFAFDLSAHDLDLLHPFHFIFDEKLRILQSGPLFKKLAKTFRVRGTELAQLCAIQEPHIALNYAKIKEQEHSTFLLTLFGKVQFSGQMVELEKQGLMAFVGGPLISSMADLEAWGLSVSDFPPHHEVHQLQSLIEQHKEKEKSALLQELIINHLHDGIALFKKDDLSLIFINHAFKELYGENFRKDKGFDDIIATLEAYKEQNSDELVRHIFAIQRLRETKYQYLEITFTQLAHSALGQLILTIHEDVSEARELESKLLQSENKTTAIMESAPAAIISTNASGTIELWNKQASVLFGYDQSEILHHNIEKILPIGTKSYLPHLNKHGFIEEPHHPPTESIGITKDGNKIPVSVTISHWMANQQLYFTVVIQDLRERKILGDQLRQAQKLEATGRLAGGVAHDFNNLLTVILGIAQDLEEISKDEKVLHHARLLTSTSMKAAELTRQLLIFSRQEIIKPENAFLNELVSDIIQMLKRIIGEDIEISYKSEPTSLIKVDKNQIGQILVNLAINARDAMPQGGRITVEVKNCFLDQVFAAKHPDIKAGPHVVLSVSDTGHGIAPDVLPRIFDPFFTTKSAGKGTGLGLSTVLGAVRQNNGCIEVESQVDKGSTFKIYFPHVLAAHLAPKSSKIKDAQQGATILLVEDQPDVRMVATTILKKSGYKIIEAENGRDALEKCQALTSKLDLLITDIIMPEMGGIDLSHQIKQLYPGIPIIYVSGYAPDALLHKNIIDKGLPYLPKPFNRQNLNKIVQETLAKSHESSTPDN